MHVITITPITTTTTLSSITARVALNAVNNCQLTIGLLFVVHKITINFMHTLNFCTLVHYNAHTNADIYIFYMILVTCSRCSMDGRGGGGGMEMAYYSLSQIVARRVEVFRAYRALSLLLFILPFLHVPLYSFC